MITYYLYAYSRPRLILYSIREHIRDIIYVRKNTWAPAVQEDKQLERLEHRLPCVSRTSRRFLPCVSCCSSAVLTLFLAVSSLKKQRVEAGVAKRTWIAFRDVRLGQGAQARARCRNNTKQEVSAVTNIWLMFSGPSAFNNALRRPEVPLWTAA